MFQAYILIEKSIGFWVGQLSFQSERGGDLNLSHHLLNYGQAIVKIFIIAYLFFWYDLRSLSKVSSTQFMYAYVVPRLATWFWSEWFTKQF